MEYTYFLVVRPFVLVSPVGFEENLSLLDMICIYLHWRLQHFGPGLGLPRRTIHKTSRRNLNGTTPVNQPRVEFLIAQAELLSPELKPMPGSGRLRSGSGDWNTWP